MHRFKEERIAELNAKAEIANTDFNLLLQEDRIAFYESCEMTQIFLYNNETKETQNYYTLFVFEEIATKDTKDKYLFPKLQKIDNKFKFGVIQKRISIGNVYFLSQIPLRG